VAITKKETLSMTWLRRLAVFGVVLLALTTLFALGQGRPSPDGDSHPGGRRFGGHGGHGGPGGPGGPPDPVMGLAGRILHDLDLTETQKSRVHGLLKSHVDSDLEPLVQDFLDARHDLEILVWNPAASDRDIAAAQGALQDASRALEKGRRRLAMDVMGALTESQRRTFHEKLASAKPPMPPGPPPEGDPDTGR
jgi:Spy/CpxP family protein refolding chaperone